MKTLLQINSSLHSGQGQSTQLANQFVRKWLDANPEGYVIVRDLAAHPLPHLTASRFQSFLTAHAKRTPEQAAMVAESDALISELRSADTVVIGLPMYNFDVPSTLKAWIDHVARAGETFRYTADGPQGLLEDRETYVFATRGGRYKDTARDTQTAYVTNFLNFLGIHNIQFVYAEGLAMDEDTRHRALDHAVQAIERLVA